MTTTIQEKTFLMIQLATAFFNALPNKEIVYTYDQKQGCYVWWHPGDMMLIFSRTYCCKSIKFKVTSCDPLVFEIESMETQESMDEILLLLMEALFYYADVLCIMKEEIPTSYRYFIPTNEVLMTVK